MVVTERLQQSMDEESRKYIDLDNVHSAIEANGGGGKGALTQDLVYGMLLTLLTEMYGPPREMMRWDASSPAGRSSGGGGQVPSSAASSCSSSMSGHRGSSAVIIPKSSGG